MASAAVASPAAGAAPNGSPRAGEVGGTSLSGVAVAALLKRLDTSDTGLTAAQARGTHQEIWPE